DRLEERELVGCDAAGAPQARLRIGRELGALARAAGAELDRPLAQAKSFDGVDEAGRPAAAAKLAVGHRRHADILLEAHDLDDGPVGGALELVAADRTGLECPRRVQQVVRPHEAADMLGAKRRLELAYRIHAPTVHLSCNKLIAKKMVCRVKPGNDGRPS